MSDKKMSIEKILFIVSGVILFLTSVASLIDLPTKLGLDVFVLGWGFIPGFIISLLALVISAFRSSGKGDLSILILVLPFMMFISWGASSAGERMETQINKEQLEKRQAEGLLPKGDVVIINKRIWNDVTVLWDEEKVQKDVARNLFKSKFEKYGEKLKKMEIIDADGYYTIIMGFNDGSTLKDVIQR